MSVNESSNIQTKKMYRAKELSTFLGVGLSTIWRYAKQGKIKAYRISGGCTVFNIEEVTKDLLVEVTYE